MQSSDEQRTIELNNLEFEVLRISNEDVLTNPANVIQKITEKLQTLPDKKNDEFLEEASQVPSTGGDLGEAFPSPSNFSAASLWVNIFISCIIAVSVNIPPIT